MKIIFTVFLSLFLFFNHGFAQLEEVVNKTKTASIAPSFWIGLPIGDFREEMDVTAYGVGVHGFAKINKSPIWLGGSFGYLSFDREKKDIRVEVANTGLFEKYKWKTAVQAIFMSGIFHYQPQVDFFLQPYFELNAGARRLFTRTTLHEDRPNDDDDNNGGDLIDSNLEGADWNFIYGGALGFQVKLNQNNDFALDFRCTYTGAASADFYARKDAVGQIDAPIDVFEERSSKTSNLLIPQIGFVLNFPIEEEEDN